VATRDREVVEDGVLKGYFLSTYSARKLGMQTTGNAGGSHNLIVKPGKRDLAGLHRPDGPRPAGHRTARPGRQLRHRRLFPRRRRLLGRERRDPYPVQEITIAGNLKDMLRGIVAVGNDVLVRGSKQVGSILVDRMTVAGA
jgi:PmbA protein